MSDAELLNSAFRTARKQHTCWLCLRPILAGSRYQDDRCAAEGRAYTLRCHTDCFTAWCSWQEDDDGYLLADLSDGHLPPCPLAWNGAADNAACTCRTAA